jgi:hypothetical protein
MSRVKMIVGAVGMLAVLALLVAPQSSDTKDTSASRFEQSREMLQQISLAREEIRKQVDEFAKHKSDVTRALDQRAENLEKKEKAILVWLKHDIQKAKRKAERAVFDRTYSVWAGLVHDEHGTPQPNMRKGASVVLLGPRDKEFCFRNEDHVYGLIAYNGGTPARPHNMEFLVRKGNGKGGRKTPPVNPFAGAPADWAREDKFDDLDLVVSGVINHFQGGDFNGWAFAVTGGRHISAIMRGGGPTHNRNYTPPALPYGYEWELCEVQIENSPTVAYEQGGTFTFRPCFTDRDRKLTPEPEQPNVPRPDGNWDWIEQLLVAP